MGVIGHLGVVLGTMCSKDVAAVEELRIVTLTAIYGLSYKNQLI